MIDWRAHFAKERQIRQCATRAGIPRPRARALAAQLASQKLPIEQRTRLLLLMAKQRITSHG